MKLRFDAATIDTPAGYAVFAFDLCQRHINDIYEACEAAKDERLVFEALQDWAAANASMFGQMPQPALAALCAALVAPKPAGGPTPAQVRDIAVRAAAVALCQRFPHLRPTRNAATLHTPSAASLLAEVVGRSEESVNKVVRGVLAKR